MRDAASDASAWGLRFPRPGQGAQDVSGVHPGGFKISARDFDGNRWLGAIGIRHREVGVSHSSSRRGGSASPRTILLAAAKPHMFLATRSEIALHLISTIGVI